MGDDWHEFFEDFPEFDPANDHLNDEQIRAKGSMWQHLEEVERNRHPETESDAESSPAPPAQQAHRADDGR